MRAWSMTLAAVGCLFGAAGVALAAAGAHRPEAALATTAGYFLLFHAAAITGFAACAHSRLLNAAATLIALGTTLFSGELALHALAKLQPVPMAAPTGGMLMIAGWLLAAIALPRALVRRA